MSSELVTATLKVTFKRKLHEVGDENKNKAERLIKERVDRIIADIEQEFGMDEGETDYLIEIEPETIKVPSYFGEAQKTLLEIGYPLEVVGEYTSERSVTELFRLCQKYCSGYPQNGG